MGHHHTARPRGAAFGTSSVLAFAAVALAILLGSTDAAAQTRTFTLDRLVMAGAPDDGIGIWRPQMGEKTRFYGQFGLGFGLRPFRVENEIANVADDRATVQRDNGTPVEAQLIEYANVGVEILDRFAFQLSFPAILFQEGNSTYHGSIAPSAVDLRSAAPMDLRADARAIVFRNTARTVKFGVEGTLWAPTGNADSYGGDAGGSGALGIAAEVDLKKVFFVLNTGVHFRPSSTVNDFHVASEFRYALGAFVPLYDDALRAGAQIFGAAGLEGPQSAANTPLEWMAEVRYRPDSRRRAWVGAGFGTRLTSGYAPDVRTVLLAGYSFGIADTDPPSPGRHFTASGPRNVHDFDDFGHAEDKKNPDDDDDDGIPNADDACPHIPGKRSADPSKNGCPVFDRPPPEGGTTINVLKEIEFETGRATILPRSFPILDEVLKLLAANPEIKHLSVEGHTDNRGSDVLNEKLSNDRAHAVRRYLVQHGVVEARLSAKGFGPHKPIADNATAEGRQKNRRVEFRILDAPP